MYLYSTFLNKHTKSFTEQKQEVKTKIMIETAEGRLQMWGHMKYDHLLGFFRVFMRLQEEDFNMSANPNKHNYFEVLQFEFHKQSGRRLSLFTAVWICSHFKHLKW